MAYTKRTTAAAATDDSMALQLRRNGSESQEAAIELIGPVVANVIEDNPEIADAIAALVVASAGIAQFQKCLHKEGAQRVWDGPSGAAATHYAIFDPITRHYIVREAPAPVPQATPAFEW